MKFNASLLGFVSTALVLSLSFSSSATASSVVVRRSELSNRAVQPQDYVAPIVARAANKNQALADYAAVQLQKQPAANKTEIITGLAKKLKKEAKSPLQSLYDHLDLAEPQVKDLNTDVNAIYVILKDLSSAFSVIAQDGSTNGQTASDEATAALKKSLDKISLYFNYIKTTPKLNRIEKAQIFADNSKGFKQVLEALKSQLQSVLSVVDTTVTGVVSDLLTPLNDLINLIVYFV